jgi:hypothetical protein
MVTLLLREVGRAEGVVEVAVLVGDPKAQGEAVGRCVLAEGTWDALARRVQTGWAVPTKLQDVLSVETSC